jgi:ATP diphosphatase
VNLARHLEVDSETALRAANRKFEAPLPPRRGSAGAQGKEPPAVRSMRLEAAWVQAKLDEAKG